MTKTASFRILLAFLTLAAIVPMALLLVYTIYSNAQQRVDEAKFSARVLANLTAEDVGQTLVAHRNMLRHLSSRPAIRAMNGAHCDQVLWDLREIFPEFANATTVDRQGTALCSAVPQPGGKPVNVAKAGWFKRTLAEEEPVVSNPFFGPITGRWVSVLTYPIRNDQKKMTGMLGFPVDLALFTPPVSMVPLLPGTVITIISADATIVWRSLDAEKWVGKSVKEHANIQRILATRQGDLEATGIDGVERFYSVIPVAGADWYAYVGIPKEEVLAETRGAVLRNAFFGMVILLCVAGLIWHIAQRVEQPVKSLLLTVRDVKHGNREVKAETGGPAEIAEVAREFNLMLDVRRQAEQRLEDLMAQQARTEAMLEQKNVDLQRFAEVTAHHLQEPSRRMANYAERLTQQLDGRLDDAETRLSLEFIGQEARRQQDLLRDVERYLAADQPRGNIESVDARQAVARTLARLKNRISAAGAEITLGDLPPARIDAPRLEDAFAVAVDNALRHGHGEQPLRIMIEGERQGSKVRYSISDNGPGVEEEYREQVFRIFERLSSSHASTGIGLAILRRVAESCDGRAWIEAAPDGGCRVLFELPVGNIGDSL
jgi:signal transduction histidine kinase